jgi:hypothetical protein
MLKLAAYPDSRVLPAYSGATVPASHRLPAQAYGHDVSGEGAVSCEAKAAPCALCRFFSRSLSLRAPFRRLAPCCPRSGVSSR